MSKRLTLTFAFAVLLTMVAATAAIAHYNPAYVEDGAYDNAKATHGHDQHQHGGTGGHLDPREDGFDVVSKLELSRVVEGKIADVGIHNDTAYLAAWGGQTCKYNGVHVVDIADVDNPEEIAFIPSKEGSYPGEGVQALTIDTTAFSGDILVTNNEKCKQPAGFGGMNIYDVSDPANPEVLAQGFGDDASNNRKQSAHQIHSVFAWQDGDNAYAVMVDDEEAADVDIVDITNPRKPQLIAEYDLTQTAAKGGPVGGPITTESHLPEVFLHDMVVKKIGGDQIMLLSYWDGGYVTMKVNDPRNAELLSDSDFGTEDPQGAEGTAPETNYEDGVQGTPLTKPNSTTVVPPEGNAHQAEFTDDNAFVLAADEDFSPYASPARNLDDGTDLLVSSGSGTQQLKPGDELEGATVFAGRACTGDTLPARGGEGFQFAVVERGVCTFSEKVANIEDVGGYEAVIVFNRTGSDACNAALGMSVEGHIYAFGVAPRQQGYELFDAESRYDDAVCKSGDGSQLAPIELNTVGDVVEIQSFFDGWGYVRLLDGSTLAEYDTYAIPEAHDPAYATGSGDLSVHEVATSREDPRLAYISYYAGGARAVRVTDDNKIQEVASFIDEGGNNFWGVEVFEQDGQEYVALSDRDFGLYILKLAE